MLHNFLRHIGQYGQEVCLSTLQEDGYSPSFPFTI